MAKELGGKLELLFAYLSINNVRHIQPLLLDAIDEYQIMKENLSYDEKKNINLIKTLLWHVEREEWTEARSHLNGAQRAYQDYINRNTAADGKTPQGYTELHGRFNSYTNIYKNAKKAPNDYMFRNSQFDPFEPRLKDHPTDKRIYTTNPRNQTHRLWSAKAIRGGHEDQGPSVTKPRRSSLDNGELNPKDKGQQYPGIHSKDKLTVDEVKNESARSNINTEREIQVTPGRKEAVDVTPRVAEDDENRPTKIADSFTALYSSQWKHALEAFKTRSIREQTAIEYLFNILMECFRLCSEESQSQVLEFEKAALNILTNGKYSEDEKEQMVKKGDVKVMIRYRKEVAYLSVKRLQDIFLTKSLPSINRKYDVQQNDVTDHYVRECVAVLWKMVIQDPPLYLVETQDVDKVYFDSRLYKPYTKTGSKVKYFVWPILQVYKGGPILARGIAQGDF